MLLLAPDVQRRLRESSGGAWFLIGFTDDGTTAVTACCAVAGGNEAQRAENFLTQRDEIEKMCGGGARVVGASATQRECSRLQSECTAHSPHTALACLMLPSMELKGSPGSAVAPLDLSRLAVARSMCPPLQQSLRIRQRVAAGGDVNHAVAEMVDDNLEFILDKIAARLKGRCVEDPLRIAVPSHAGSAEDIWALNDADEDGSGYVEISLSLAAAPVAGVGLTQHAASSRLLEDVARCVRHSVEEYRQQLDMEGRSPVPGSNAVPSRRSVTPQQPWLAAHPVWQGYGTPKQVRAAYSEILGSKVVLEAGGRSVSRSGASGPPGLLMGGLVALLAVLLCAMSLCWEGGCS